MTVDSTNSRVSHTRTWLARSLIAVAAATAFGAATLPSSAHAGVFISVNFAPPVLPVYVQPAIPAPGYIWTPGYWAYAPDGGYYWVPGTWIMPPFVGALWTPGYWGWSDGAYLFHAGYWGTHVGFYGGVNYGFGYSGVGYAGGYWGPHGFYYNSAVNHFANVNITNVYNHPVVVDNNVSRVSFNGGAGGLTARPNAEEMRFANEPHTPPVAAQLSHETLARSNPAMRATVNHGSPSIAATSHPGAFAPHPGAPVGGPGHPGGPAGGPGHPGGPVTNNVHPGGPVGSNARPMVHSTGYAPHPNGAPTVNSAPHGPAPGVGMQNRPVAPQQFNAPAQHTNTSHPAASHPEGHESHPSRR